MTESDRLSALELATEDHKFNQFGGINVGGLNFKKSQGNPFGVEAAQLLMQSNGTILWDREDPLNGAGTFNNIYQFAAAEINAPLGTLRQRMEVSEEYESQARQGFNSLASWLVDVFGAPLFRLSESGAANKTVLITVHPDLVPSYSHKTVAELVREKDMKQVRGQVSAARKRLSRQFEETEVGILLRQAVDTELLTAIEQPRLDLEG